MTEKRRVRMDFEYMGTNYVGWQLQPNGVSVQEVAEKALSKLVGHHVRFTASGRTDAGVHALLQPASVDVETRMSDAELMRGMNALLPDDVVVKSVKAVPPDWSARYEAKEKTYVYTILNRPYPSAFERDRVWHVKTPLDVMAMREAARALLGEHDFTSFQSAGCAAKNPVRRLVRLEIEKEGDTLRMTFAANGFLKQMVRNMTGALVEVGRGKQPSSWIGEVLSAKDRTKAGPCAPPQGLCLVEVVYEA